MSRMRASGAMPTITALQIATASLAVPKSVMKTIAGCEAAPGIRDEFLSAGELEQAAAKTTAPSKDKNNRRITKIIPSPENQLGNFFSRVSVSRTVDIRQ